MNKLIALALIGTTIIILWYLFNKKQFDLPITILVLGVIYIEAFFFYKLSKLLDLLK